MDTAVIANETRAEQREVADVRADVDEDVAGAEKVSRTTEVTCGSHTPEVASIRPVTSDVSTHMRLPPTTATSSRASIPSTSGVATCDTAAARSARTGSRCGTARTARASLGREPRRVPSAGRARARGALIAWIHARILAPADADTADTVRKTNRRYYASGRNDPQEHLAECRSTGASAT